MSEPDSSASSPKPRLFDRLRSLFGLGGASIRDDIEVALEGDAPDAGFTPQERSMLRNVLGLHEVRIADIMIPRADIIAVGLDTSLANVLATFRTAGHSRLPVHGETLDDPRGMVHIRDFVDYIAAAAEAGMGARRRRLPKPASEEAPRPDLQAIASLGGLDLALPLSAARILRPVLFAPPSMPALDLLVKMQATRTHMALIIDEYGGTDGLVSMEDIVEVIVGDIEDEHDEDESPKITKLPDGTFTADARALLEIVSAETGCALSELSDAEEVDTLGGLITALAGRVPIRGEIILASDGNEFEILDADPRRLKRIRIRLGAGRTHNEPEGATTPAGVGKSQTAA